MNPYFYYNNNKNNFNNMNNNLNNIQNDNTNISSFANNIQQQNNDKSRFYSQQQRLPYISSETVNNNMDNNYYDYLSEFVNNNNTTSANNNTTSTNNKNNSNNVNSTNNIIFNKENKNTGSYLNNNFQVLLPSAGSEILPININNINSSNSVNHINISNIHNNDNFNLINPSADAARLRQQQKEKNEPSGPIIAQTNVNFSSGNIADSDLIVIDEEDDRRDSVNFVASQNIELILPLSQSGSHLSPVIFPTHSLSALQQAENLSLLVLSEGNNLISSANININNNGNDGGCVNGNNTGNFSNNNQNETALIASNQEFSPHFSSPPSQSILSPHQFPSVVQSLSPILHLQHQAESFPFATMAFDTGNGCSGGDGSCIINNNNAVTGNINTYPNTMSKVSSFENFLSVSDNCNNGNNINLYGIGNNNINNNISNNISNDFVAIKQSGKLIYQRLSQSDFSLLQHLSQLQVSQPTTSTTVNTVNNTNKQLTMFQMPISQNNVISLSNLTCNNKDTLVNIIDNNNNSNSSCNINDKYFNNNNNFKNNNNNNNNSAVMNGINSNTALDEGFLIASDRDTFQQLAETPQVDHYQQLHVLPTMATMQLQQQQISQQPLKLFQDYNSASHFSYSADNNNTGNFSSLVEVNDNIGNNNNLIEYGNNINSTRINNSVDNFYSPLNPYSFYPYAYYMANNCASDNLYSSYNIINNSNDNTLFLSTTNATVISCNNVSTIEKEITNKVICERMKKKKKKPRRRKKRRNNKRDNNNNNICDNVIEFSSNDEDIVKKNSLYPDGIVDVCINNINIDNNNNNSNFNDNSCCSGNKIKNNISSSISGRNKSINSNSVLNIYSYTPLTLESLNNNNIFNIEGDKKEDNFLINKTKGIESGNLISSKKLSSLETLSPLISPDNNNELQALGMREERNAKNVELNEIRLEKSDFPLNTIQNLSASNFNTNSKVNTSLIRNATNDCAGGINNNNNPREAVTITSPLSDSFSSDIKAVPGFDGSSINFIKNHGIDNFNTTSNSINDKINYNKTNINKTNSSKIPPISSLLTLNSSLYNVCCGNSNINSSNNCYPLNSLTAVTEMTVTNRITQHRYKFVDCDNLLAVKPQEKEEGDEVNQGNNSAFINKRNDYHGKENLCCKSDKKVYQNGYNIEGCSSNNNSSSSTSSSNSGTSSSNISGTYSSNIIEVKDEVYKRYKLTCYKVKRYQNVIFKNKANRWRQVDKTFISDDVMKRRGLKEVTHDEIKRQRVGEKKDENPSTRFSQRTIVSDIDERCKIVRTGVDSFNENSKSGTSCSDSRCGGTSCSGTSCSDSRCGDSSCSDSRCGGTSCSGTSCSDSRCGGTSCSDSRCGGTSCSDSRCDDGYSHCGCDYCTGSDYYHFGQNINDDKGKKSSSKFFSFISGASSAPDEYILKAAKNRAENHPDFFLPISHNNSNVNNQVRKDDVDKNADEKKNYSIDDNKTNQDKSKLVPFSAVNIDINNDPVQGGENCVNIINNNIINNNVIDKKDNNYMGEIFKALHEIIDERNEDILHFFYENDDKNFNQNRNYSSIRDFITCDDKMFFSTRDDNNSNFNNIKIIGKYNKCDNSSSNVFYPHSPSSSSSCSEVPRSLSFNSVPLILHEGGAKEITTACIESKIDANANLSKSGSGYKEEGLTSVPGNGFTPGPPASITSVVNSPLNSKGHIRASSLLSSASVVSGKKTFEQLTDNCGIDGNNHNNNNNNNNNEGDNDDNNNSNINNNNGENQGENSISSFIAPLGVIEDENGLKCKVKVANPARFCHEYDTVLSYLITLLPDRIPTLTKLVTGSYVNSSEITQKGISGEDVVDTKLYKKKSEGNFVRELSTVDNRWVLTDNKKGESLSTSLSSPSHLIKQRNVKTREEKSLETLKDEVVGLKNKNVNVNNLFVSLHKTNRRFRDGNNSNNNDNYKDEDDINHGDGDNSVVNDNDTFKYDQSGAIVVSNSCNTESGCCCVDNCVNNNTNNNGITISDRVLGEDFSLSFSSFNDESDGNNDDDGDDDINKDGKTLEVFKMIPNSKADNKKKGRDGKRYHNLNEINNDNDGNNCDISCCKRVKRYKKLVGKRVKTLAKELINNIFISKGVKNKKANNDSDEDDNFANKDVIKVNKTFFNDISGFSSTNSDNILGAVNNGEYNFPDNIPKEKSGASTASVINEDAANAALRDIEVNITNKTTTTTVDIGLYLCPYCCHLFKTWTQLTKHLDIFHSGGSVLIKSRDKHSNVYSKDKCCCRKEEEGISVNHKVEVKSGQFSAKDNGENAKNNINSDGNHGTREQIFPSELSLLRQLPSHLPLLPSTLSTLLAHNYQPHCIDCNIIARTHGLSHPHRHEKELLIFDINNTFDKDKREEKNGLRIGDKVSQHPPFHSYLHGVTDNITNNGDAIVGSGRGNAGKSANHVNISSKAIISSSLASNLGDSKEINLTSSNVKRGSDVQLRDKGHGTGHSSPPDTTDGFGLNTLYHNNSDNYYKNVAVGLNNGGGEVEDNNHRLYHSTRGNSLALSSVFRLRDDYFINFRIKSTVTHTFVTYENIVDNNSPVNERFDDNVVSEVYNNGSKLNGIDGGYVDNNKNNTIKIEGGGTVYEKDSVTFGKNKFIDKTGVRKKEDRVKCDRNARNNITFDKGNSDRRNLDPSIFVSVRTTLDISCNNNNNNYNVCNINTNTVVDNENSQASAKIISPSSSASAPIKVNNNNNKGSDISSNNVKFDKNLKTQKNPLHYSSSAAAVSAGNNSELSGILSNSSSYSSSLHPTPNRLQQHQIPPQEQRMHQLQRKINSFSIPQVQYCCEYCHLFTDSNIENANNGGLVRKDDIFTRGKETLVTFSKAIALINHYDSSHLDVIGKIVVNKEVDEEGHKRGIKSLRYRCFCVLCGYEPFSLANANEHLHWHLVNITIYHDKIDSSRLIGDKNNNRATVLSVSSRLSPPEPTIEANNVPVDENENDVKGGKGEIYNVINMCNYNGDIIVFYPYFNRSDGVSGRDEATDSSVGITQPSGVLCSPIFVPYFIYFNKINFENDKDSTFDISLSDIIAPFLGYDLSIINKKNDGNFSYSSNNDIIGELGEEMPYINALIKYQPLCRGSGDNKSKSKNNETLNNEINDENREEFYYVKCGNYSDEKRKVSWSRICQERGKNGSGDDKNDIIKTDLNDILYPIDLYKDKYFYYYYGEGVDLDKSNGKKVTINDNLWGLPEDKSGDLVIVEKKYNENIDFNIKDTDNSIDICNVNKSVRKDNNRTKSSKIPLLSTTISLLIDDETRCFNSPNEANEYCNKISRTIESVVKERCEQLSKVLLTQRQEQKLKQREHQRIRLEQIIMKHKSQNYLIQQLQQQPHQGMFQIPVFSDNLIHNVCHDTNSGVSNSLSGISQNSYQYQQLHPKDAFFTPQNNQQVKKQQVSNFTSNYIQHPQQLFSSFVGNNNSNNFINTINGVDNINNNSSSGNSSYGNFSYSNNYARDNSYNPEQIKLWQQYYNYPLNQYQNQQFLQN